MTFENNFINHSKEYIFVDNQTLLNQRQKIFEKISQKNYDKKNNESLKHITISDLSNFDYFFKSENEGSKVTITDKYNYEIRVVNGICKNYEDDNIEIRNFTNLDFKNFLNQENNNLDDIIIDFNKIFLNAGIFFNVKNNSKINIRLIHNTSDNFTIFQNNFINFKKNCEVQLEDYFNLAHNSINNVSYNTNIEEGALINHNIFQNFSTSNKLYLTSNTVCEKNSSYKQNTFNFSDGFVRNFHHAHLNGEFANASLNGCFFLKDKNLCTNKTNIIHNAEHCVSEQTYKGILNDYSKANYFSNTFVSENAQKTEGYQLSKGILLTDNCSFFSKPELRIFADDVKCSHGSTIGPVDESALYYLRSRGINKKEALKMIISSFIQENMYNLDKNIADQISDNLSNYLKSLEND
ncbi:SufD family Fe-S cluster assembly protein [Alphaproteobacteria bacterium]|nr:SufD family Fe-S cluster assembly protein [Alphaproteobacteria bacterium]